MRNLDRRTFLAWCAGVALLVPGRRLRAATVRRGGPHPTPRPGITAANVLSHDQLATAPHVIDVFDFGPDGKIVQMRAYWGPDNLVGDLAVRQS